MRENTNHPTAGNDASHSLIRENAALRLAVLTLSDLHLMGLVANPAIEHHESRVQYAAAFLAKLASESSVIAAMARMLSLEGPESTPDECFDADRMMVRLACREVEAVAAVEAQ